MQVNFDFESYKAMFSGGARSYLFYVPFVFPGAGSSADTSGNSIMNFVTNLATNALSTFGLGADDKMYPYLVKSTNLPEASFEEVGVKYGGVIYKIAGDRTFGDWTVQLNIDDKGKVLDKFHAWQTKIYDLSSGIAGLPVDYMKDQEIHLLDYTGNTMKSYKLFGCWPKSISTVSLDYATTDTITVDITFSYLYYEIMSIDSNTSSLIKKGFNLIAGKF